jgi:hypothetical protein
MTFNLALLRIAEAEILTALHCPVCGAMLDTKDPTALVSVRGVKQPLLETEELLGEGEPILVIVVERQD